MKNTYLKKLTQKIKDVPFGYDESINGLEGLMIFFIIGRFISMSFAFLKHIGFLIFYYYKNMQLILVLILV